MRQKCAITLSPQGRHALIASVVRMVVPLPGVETSAKGLLLLCELVDGGDLEEAMSSKAAVRKCQPDYAGHLWDAPSATTWPLAAVTLQIFHGLKHVHERGIIHQVATEKRERTDRRTERESRQNIERREEDRKAVERLTERETQRRE